MSRTNLLVCSLLTGCMKVYSDSDLPDIDVTWDDFECTSGMTAPPAGDVTVTLKSEDSDATATMTTACATHELVFPDMQRERFRVEARRATPGEPLLSVSDQEADVRTGFDTNVSLYFGPPANVHVAWRLPDGVTCASLHRPYVLVGYDDPSGPASLGGNPCAFLEADLYAPPGEYVFQLQALDDHIVATSPKTAPVAVDELHVTDLGTLDLLP